MTLQYDFNPEHDLLIARCSGLVTDQDFMDALNDIVPRSKGDALRTNVLITFDENTDVHVLNFEALDHVKDCIEGWLETYPGRNVRTALIGDFAATTAIFTLWRALADAYALGADVEVFQREDHARAWLKEG